ncbi:MAG: exodeoxyribonuclease VII small subunit [Chloroflexi bacterium]|nr:exodeoxyribonuclease VII small subunit [Chloroflexota bacterium]MQG05137.1 exodeoxyribonuclease VII small subunit [SAR202 cluster bacterium]|tara:strand:+ start:16420 stop:16650 length:231 start_codon:yes stop_codon:yes gene_type:complete
MVKKKPKIEMSFEEAVEQLKTTTEELEQGKLSLDRAMELYENGMELATYCFELLNKAEIKIQEINVNHQIDLDKEE